MKNQNLEVITFKTTKKIKNCVAKAAEKEMISIAELMRRVVSNEFVSKKGKKRGIKNKQVKC